MFQTIVVPLDGSGFGEGAVPWAVSVARRSGGSIHLVTVVTPIPQVLGGDEDPRVEGDRLALAREHARAYLEKLQQRAGRLGPGVPVLTRVELGPVVESLVRCVEELRGDLVVMSSHGRGPFRRAWLGSVTDGLLRRAPAPILVVRPEDAGEAKGSDPLGPEGEVGADPQAAAPPELPRLQHLMVTLDGSPQSAEVLPYAAGLARLFGARMTLVRVIPPRFLLGPAFAPAPGREAADSEGEARTVREYLEARAFPLRQAGLEVGVQVVLGTHVAEGILWCSEDLKADLLALATHGRGGVSRLLLGSVADKVVRGSPGPVLLHRQVVPSTPSPREV